jgi:hypothetical protein
VVFDAPSGQAGWNWFRVQPVVAGHARACEAPDGAVSRGHDHTSTACSIASLSSAASSMMALSESSSTR